MKLRQEPLCETCESRNRNPVFNDCPLEKLSFLNTNKTCVTYERGQHIFYEGHPPLGIYCLYKGKVKIYKNGYQGKEQIVRFGREGDLLGYRALLCDESYSASAVSLEECTCCFLNKEDFYQVIRGDNPNLYSRLVKLLSRDLGDAETKLTNLAQKSVRERLAESILLLDRLYGQPIPNTNYSRIEANLSREDLANIVGTATETIIRILSEFKDDKIINTEEKRIVIYEKKKLMKIGSIVD